MSLTPHDIARMLDHSTLQPFLTEDDIRRGCELALKYDTASVCARPCDVPILAEMLRGSDVKVCTVIGFPHGAHATQIKVDEAGLAEVNGRFMGVITETNGGAPPGGEALAATLSEPRDTLEDVYEPYLIMEGYLHRTPQGRVVTELAYRRVNLSPPAGRQSSLL